MAGRRCWFHFLDDFLLMRRPRCSARLCSLVLLVALLAVPLSAKDKKKPTLPDYVLRAETVRVVIAPDAGEPLDQPLANSTARENVEKALSEWGRYPVLEWTPADLLIAVRTGSEDGGTDDQGRARRQPAGSASDRQQLRIGASTERRRARTRRVRRRMARIWQRDWIVRRHVRSV